MLTLINYGTGNLRAFCNVYNRLGIQTAIASTVKDLYSASKLILPGVGAFDSAMHQFNQTGMRDTIARMVLEEGIPLLGVCVGMQMLASSSDEGLLPGLGWIQGRVRKLRAISQGASICLPHMGWNDLKPLDKQSLFSYLETPASFYFLHSYYFDCTHAENITATSYYGQDFASVVNHQNIYGVQFHPEKSHDDGAQLLKHFSEL